MKNLDIQRKIVANMTTESWRNIPHVAFSYEPDITEFEKHYLSNKGSVKFNTLILSLIASALKEAPKMNAHFSYNKWLVTGHLDLKSTVDISMPTILPDGRMMTVNLRDCASKSPSELQAYIDEMRARSASTSLDDVMMEVAMKNTFHSLFRGHIHRSVGRLLGRLFHPHCANLLKGEERRKYKS